MDYLMTDPTGQLELTDTEIIQKLLAGLEHLGYELPYPESLKQTETSKQTDTRPPHAIPFFEMDDVGGKKKQKQNKNKTKQNKNKTKQKNKTKKQNKTKQNK